MVYRIDLNPTKTMNIAEIAEVKHPVQAFLRRQLGGSVRLLIKREEQALDIANYNGDAERLKTAINKALDNNHTHTKITRPKFVEIADEEEPKSSTAPKIDEELKYELEVLETEREVLETMMLGKEQDLAEAQKKIDWFSDEYKKVDKVNDLQIELDNLKSEHATTLEELTNTEKTNDGLKTSYGRKDKQVKDLQSQLDELTDLVAELGSKKLDCKEASIAFVKQCSNDLKTYERKLAEIVGNDDINNLLKLNDLDLVRYINLRTLRSHTSEEIYVMINSMAEQFAETKFYAENKVRYDEAKSSINFIDNITKSNLPIPELLRSSYEKLKINETEYKAIIAEFEGKERYHKENTDAHNNIKKAYEQFNKAQKLKDLKANAPSFRICIYSNEETGVATIYLPHGLENGYVMQTTLVSHYDPKIDDTKSIIEITAPKAEPLDTKKFVGYIRKTLEHMLPKVVCEEIKVY